MKEETKTTTISIKLDEESVQILKNINPIHRDSVINVGLSLISKTGYYKTLLGKNITEDLEEVVSLEAEDNASSENSSKKSKKEVVASEKVSWDAF